MFTTERMLIVILLSHCILGSLISAKTCFEMFPRGDVLIMAGKQLRLNCSLKLLEIDGDCADDYNADATNLLRILKGSQTLPPKLFHYFEEQKTLMLTIRNATFEDNGFYRCLYGNNFQSVKRVRIGVPPGAPEDLRCMSRNWNDLICSFTVSKTKENIPTRYFTQFRLNEQSNWTTLPESNFRCLDETTCSCWLDSRNEEPTLYTFMPSAKYKIRVVEENKLGTNFTDLIIKSTASIVKPDPVVFDYTTYSRRLRLGWSCPEDLILLGHMDYKINITSKWDSRIVIFKLVHNRTTNRVEKYIENLTPYTSYTVTVQAKPSAAQQDIYWSNASRKIIFESLRAVSEHTVLTTAGSYMILKPGRTVLYWKNPPRRYWYGPITGYQIILEKVVLADNIVNNIDLEYTGKQNMNKDGTEPESENITGITVRAALRSKIVDTDTYQVGIKLENSEGVSSNSSELIIPNGKIGLALRPKWVSVEMAVSSVYISWFMDQRFCAAITSVAYYWCKSDIDRSFNSSYVPCKDQFDWKIIDISDGCGNPIRHEIRHISNHHDMKYSVSVQTASQLSGGMIWEKFRFSKFGVPEKPLYAVSADGTNLKVQVLYGAYYVSEGGKPDNYSVEYTECRDNDDCISATSNSTVKIFPANFLNPEYVIGDLKSGTQYKVLVSSINSVGGSDHGEPILITLTMDVDTPVAWIAKTLGGVTGGIACVLIVFLACLGKKRYNVFKKKASAINIPDMDEINLFERKDSPLMALDDYESAIKGSDSPRPYRQTTEGDMICQGEGLLDVSIESIDRPNNVSTASSVSPAETEFLKGQRCDPYKKEISDAECDTCTNKKDNEISYIKSKAIMYEMEDVLPNKIDGVLNSTFRPDEGRSIGIEHLYSLDDKDSKTDTSEAECVSKHATEHDLCNKSEMPVLGKRKFGRECNSQGYVLNDIDLRDRRTPEKTCDKSDYMIANANANELKNRDYCQQNENHVHSTEADFSEKMLGHLVSFSVEIKNEDNNQEQGSSEYVREVFNLAVERSTQDVNAVNTEYQSYVLSMDLFST